MKTVSSAVAVSTVLLCLFGCNPFEPDQSVILGVTKLDAPASIAAGASFAVTLTVQTGGCTSFDRIEVQKTSSSVRLVPWGKDARVGHKDIMCPDVIYDTPHTLQFNPPFDNPFQVYVEQGRLAPLTASVRIL